MTTKIPTRKSRSEVDWDHDHEGMEFQYLPMCTQRHLSYGMICHEKLLEIVIMSSASDFQCLKQRGATLYYCGNERVEVVGVCVW